MTVSALVLGSIAMTVTWASVGRTQGDVDHIVNSIQPPKDRLLAAARANAAGHTAITAAVSATGEDRSRLLSEAISASEQMSVEFTKYRAQAIGLPGEDELVAQYDADRELAEATASSALIPILNSTLPAGLPVEAVEANKAVALDLAGLHTLYLSADRAAFVDLGREADRAQQFVLIGAILGLAFVLISAWFAYRRARRAVAARKVRAAASALSAFETRLRRALSLVDTDTSVYAVTERAMREVLPGVRSSLLIADSSRARLDPVGESPVCGVTTPDNCPALRGGAALSFTDSEALDACPTLAMNSEAPCSATCVPVSIAGRGAALMHLAGPVDAPPDQQGALDLLSRSVGDRVTMLQALATFQLQAERDPLTGLLNRRSLSAAVSRVIAGGGEYAVAFGDLDHFKRLNDLHGHEAGDRALRAFARTLRDSLRPQDISCRWGGEEFIVVLPGCNAEQAVEVMDRVRTNLALGALAGQTTVVTVSFGVAHSSDAEEFDEVVERADDALREAKETGRNRVVAFVQGQGQGQGQPVVPVPQTGTVSEAV